MSEEHENNQDDNDQGGYWDKPAFGGAAENQSRLNGVAEEGNRNAKPREVNIDKYKDLGGLSVRKLNIGLWYVEHKKFLRNMFIGFLTLAASVLWAYAIYGFVYYITRGIDEDELLARQMVDSGNINHSAVLAASARDLVVGRIGSLKSNSGKYDFFVQAQNPNNRHGAEFEYYFLAGGNETDRRSGFILPGESKYLLSLSNELDSKPSNVQLKFENFRWERINRHEIADWNLYRDERLSIRVSDVNFTPAGRGGLSGKAQLNHLGFTASNETDYNYWLVEFVVLLYGGPNSIVGVNQYRIDEFMSGQTHQASINWPGTISRVARTEIIPEINLLKDDIYIKYEGKTGEKR